MASHEYIEIVTLMMEKQDMYLMWFLGIFSIVLVFVGVLQWRLSSKQLSQIKSETKKEAREEIISELIQSYQVNMVPTYYASILSYQDELNKTRNELSQNLRDISNKLEQIKIDQDYSLSTEIIFFTRKLKSMSSDIEKELYYFTIKYYAYLVRNENLAKKFTSNLEESDVFKKIDNTSEYWNSFRKLIIDLRKELNNQELFTEIDTTDLED